jgi:hypothetical protein
MSTGTGTLVSFDRFEAFGAGVDFFFMASAFSRLDNAFADDAGFSTRETSETGCSAEVRRPLKQRVGQAESPGRFQSACPIGRAKWRFHWLGRSFTPGAPEKLGYCCE